jgi:hypothetical protein
MFEWTSQRVSPFAVFVTLLLAVAGIVALTAVLALRQPPAEPRGVLPFPESQRDSYVLDGIAGHLHRPNIVRTVVWPEHPDGRFEFRTNNLGFREDSETAVAKPADSYRVLVTGDSHIDGVVANPESFPNLLESRLNRDRKSLSFEVINGGTGHYGPANYAGVLRRFLDLGLDRFVVVIFTGNDILDAVAEAWAAGSLEIPQRPASYMERLEAAQRLSPAAVSQGYNQILFFVTFPELEQLAIALTVKAMTEIHRLASDRGVRVDILLLPAKLDVEPASDAARQAEVIETLALTPEQLTVNRRLAVRLAEALSEAGLSVIDPFPEFLSSEHELFWVRDYHLSVSGHGLLTDVYLDRMGRLLLSDASAKLGIRNVE